MSNNKPFLTEEDTIKGSQNTDYTGEIVILNEINLKEEYKIQINQIWTASHGPGCRANKFSDTVHLKHPIDKDYMIVSRSDILGVVKPEVLAKLMAEYNQAVETDDEEFDR